MIMTILYKAVQMLETLLFMEGDVEKACVAKAGLKQGNYFWDGYK